MKTTKGLKIGANLAYMLSAAFIIAAVIVSILPPKPVFAGNASNGTLSTTANGNSGAIWTTLAACGIDSQDVNHFEIGQQVFINGANFHANTEYEWAITGLPGGASADPGVDVASGTFTTDDSGAFCFFAYTVASDDDGEYQVKFSNKGDNYRVDGEQPIPGCMDPDAINYDPDATIDDRSCNYDETSIPAPYAELNCFSLASDAYKVTIGNTGQVGEVGYSTDLDATIISLGVLTNGASTDVLVPSGASVLNLHHMENGGWTGSDSISLSKVELQICEVDPISLVSICSYVDAQQPFAWTVNNLNDFSIAFTWVYGSESSAAPIALAVGESYSFTTGNQIGETMRVYVNGYELASGQPPVCPRFATPQLTAYCSGDPANVYGWSATNTNAFAIDAEWRVNGSLLAGLLSIPANASINFTTPAAEGNIVQLYVGGVQQDDAVAVTTCVDPETPPQNPEPPQPPQPPLPPVTTGTGTAVLIPVTGIGDDLPTSLPFRFGSLALSFLGLGIVLNAFARRIS